MADIVAGRAPPDPARCAEVLRSYLAKGRWPRELESVIRAIEDEAVKAAGRKVIGLTGRINPKSRFARELVPHLAGLGVMALIRLKLETWLKGLRDRLERYLK
jgi:hypothetical protein